MLRLFSPSLLILMAGFAGPALGDITVNDTSGCDLPLRPFHAEYDVYRNGKLLGESIANLALEADGQWTYAVATEANRGIGGLLGGRIHETSRFHFKAGVPQALSYDLLQKVAFSKTVRTANFDWESGVVSGKNKRKDWHLELEGHETDRLLADFMMKRALAQGKTEIAIKTVEKGDFTVREFEVREAETISTGLGEMLAIPVHRKHGSDKRSTVTWYVPKLDYLSVRTDHAKKDGDSGKLILRKLEQADCSEPIKQTSADS